MKKKKTKKKLIKKKTKKKLIKKQTKKKLVKKKSINNSKKKNNSLSINFLNNPNTSIALKDLENNIFLIPKNIYFQGNIRTSKKIIILGNVDADIECHEIYLAPKSTIKGSLRASIVYLYGDCNANIFSKSACYICKGSRVVGDINYENLINIEEGSLVLGNLIPKKKPLALPDYTKKNDSNNFSDRNLNNKIHIKNNYQSTFEEESHTKERKNVKAIDRIISKIFK